MSRTPERPEKTIAPFKTKTMNLNKRITKAMSEEVAEKLCKKFEVEIEKATKNLSQFVTDALKAKIDQRVLDFYQDNKGYVNTISSYQLGQKFTWTRINLIGQIPSSTTVKDELNKDELKKVKELLKLKEAAKKNLSDTKKEIVSALIGLRTYKRVQSDFPEAYKLLPPVSSTLLPSVNLTNLRDRL